MHEEQLKATMTSAVEGRISAKNAEKRGHLRCGLTFCQTKADSPSRDIKAGQCAGNLGPKQAQQLGADKTADVSGAEKWQSSSVA